MKFSLFLESVYSLRSILVQAIDAVANRNIQLIGVLGDQLQDHGEPLGETMVRLFNGETVHVGRVQHGITYENNHCFVMSNIIGNPSIEGYIYIFSNNKYNVTLRININSDRIHAFIIEMIYPKNNVISGENAIFKRKEILRIHRFGRENESISLSALPKYFPVPAPSEENLRRILQTLLFLYDYS